MLKNKVMLDTNAVIRFLAGGNKEERIKIAELINTTDCIVSIEVIAEAVFNLEKYFEHDRQLVAQKIKDFIGIKEDLVLDENVVRYGCNVYASTRLDFVDCLLVGYAYVNGNPVFTFDNELKKKLEHKAITW